MTEHRWKKWIYAANPRILCLVVTCILASLTGLSLVYLGDNTTRPVSSKAELSQLPQVDSAVSSPFYAASLSQSSSQETRQVRYLMKNYGGRLAVFEAQQQSPLLVFDVYVNTLPEYDQQLLQEGISVEGEQQLTRIIEDYIS